MRVGLVFSVLLIFTAFIRTCPVAQAADVPASEMLNLRDPFRRPEIKIENVQRNPLENFPIDQIKIMGIVTGPHHMRAMVGTPDGKTLFISENTKMGQHQGVVTKITADLIRVREKIVNVLGQEESLETDILLAPEKKSR